MWDTPYKIFFWSPFKPLDITEIEMRQIVVYPNPAKNYLAVEYELNTTFINSVIIVNSVKGGPLFEIKVQEIAGLKIINLQDWATGIYIVSLKSNGKIIQSEKFTKY